MKNTPEPIAIIGTGCRFPGGCNNPSKLWELLRNPVDLLKEIPEDRFNVDGFYHNDNSHHGTSNVRHSYLLDDDLRHFDAEFFGIKATEANSIDPQQRLLLETVYESLEAAGLSMKQLRGSDTAVYVGVMSADFTDMIGRDVETFPTYFATGTARSILSNRLSYFFDWHGPSMTIDTACSSSLIAMHQAVQTLRAGDASVAVVAGSNIILGPEQYIAESKLQMLSPTGRSRMWDAGADGYARGEGVAAIVLKPLSRALADGDHIECVIRETGVNQDGKTPGITMPSATAQAALIRSTYARAGLDLGKRSDRPQFFEAHGTGTPAGDPIEAQAIYDTFFGQQSQFGTTQSGETLYTGSIKTVIGHTEGTAGLAAVIKASLALQSGELPPNRLFNKLNPKIEPFYGPIKILSEARKWPELIGDGVRRVSVNSFGFGGANCHAILESADTYISALDNGRAKHDNRDSYSYSPYLFSAATDTALGSMLGAALNYLENPQTGAALNLKDLCWTLHKRRTTHACRAVVPASMDLKSLIDNLKQSMQSLNENSDSLMAKSRLPETPLRVLGIFTGQGAQWPRMGAEIIESSLVAGRILESLDESLQSLPRQDRPTWSLREQLLAPGDSSMVGTAALSQPLCTAVQIILVDMLKAANVNFSAVVGHSSGEIGAAYASGHITATDAIRVAYYRGLHLKSVTLQGAMLAVGTSYEDATELCSLPAFEGRVCVAASNSPASVTLSGDADAIEEIKELLDEEKKFNRLLKVDRAYHSHHMQVCAESYIRSLEQCGIKTRPANAASNCRWVSSVFTCDISRIPSSEGLGASYWADNLTRPVRFAESLGLLLDGDSSAEFGAYDLVVEVGPHPALKGPVSQTIQECSPSQSIPYTGVMARGTNSIEAFSAGLGFIWRTFGDGAVDFAAYDRFLSGQQPHAYHSKPVKGLPTYPWDHKRKFWHESRISQAFRTRKDQPHMLLGRQILDGAPGSMRWRNIIKRSEIDWLDGHQVQGQTVFPCAGYLSACLEACMRASGDENAQSIEIHKFDIGHAMAFEDDDSGIDALISLNNIKRAETGKRREITANFAFHSAPNNNTLKMTMHANGEVVIVLGDKEQNVLPPKAPDDGKWALLDVEEDRFYDALGKLGFGYSGPFRALKDLKRKLGSAQGIIQNPASTTSEKTPPLLVHPATLDAAIQSIMLAFCYPGDSMLRSIYLPTSIGRLIVNPLHCLEFSGKSAAVPFDSVASVSTTKSLSGDVSIYLPGGFSSKAIQLEGLQTRPLSDPTQSDELNIFTELTWDIDRPESEAVVARTRVPELNAELLVSLERVAYFYLRTLNDTIPSTQRVDLEWHFKRLFAYVDHVLPRVADRSNPFAKTEWIHDSKHDIEAIIDKYPHNADLKLMRAVGENIAAVVRGETTMLEHMVQDNKLNDFYVYAEGMPRYTAYLAAFASQIGHRYPHMNVLEIGAGTGGATKSFLRELGDQFATYTFTDISSGFFEKASSVFSSYRSKMDFKVLDIEKDIQGQNFDEGSFDVIIASLVLHATRNLDQTLRNVRKLLKPGGYLLLLEITENEQMRFGLLFGGLPGWWLGYDDNRALSPCIGLEEWNSLLRHTGFSGIDTVVPHENKLPVPLSVLVSQAVDEKVEFLRLPLRQSSDNVMIPRLTIVGDGPKSAELASAIQHTLGWRCGHIEFVDSLQSIQEAGLPVGGSVLCLSDIDGPVFESMNPAKLRGFQEIFKQSTNVLWVSIGARGGDPYARMVVGFGRTIVLEMLHLRLQFLDLDPTATPDPVAIAESLLRFEVAGGWDERGDTNSSLLYAIEPEVFLDAAGKFHVPRFKLNQSQNNRYKSNRGTVTEKIDITESTVELKYGENNYELIESNYGQAAHAWSAQEPVVEIDVIYSINRSVRISQGCFLFPVVGESKVSGERVLALSPISASKILIPRSFVMAELGVKDDDMVGTLQLFHSELLAWAALAEISAEAEIILVQPSEAFAQAVERQAADAGTGILCLASHPSTKWEYVHPKTSKFAIQNLVLSKIDPRADCSLIDMGDDHYVAASVEDCLTPGQVKVVQKTDLVSTTGRLPKRDIRKDVRSALTVARYALQNQNCTNDLLQSGLPTSSLEQLVSTIDSRPMVEKECVVSWKPLTGKITASVNIIDKEVRFRADKTYWLVGLTGGLGLSLCFWMARQGARYIAITSRSPKVDEGFVRKMKTLGVTVLVIPADVCVRDSIHEAYKKIKQTLPAIGGVAQGAMVLHDTMFIDLDMERVNNVMKPKVQGSTYLEEIFYSIDLEFFVFFSSMACVTGNPGQSAYAAANMFMSGLASKRRQRGLNASAVHIGAIFGNGYVTRELTLTQQQFLKKVGNLWLSEQDFHNLFAEAVYAGQASRAQNPELSTGLMMIEDSDEFRKNITWFKNPMFQHCVRNTQSTEAIGTTGKGGRGIQVKAQLQDAIFPDDVREMIYAAFSSKLQSSLQVEEGRPIADLTADMLGIDSLVAVDIRSWFIKELQVEIPVLKILSGATVGEILVQVQELLPKELTPNLNPTAKGSSKMKQNIQQRNDSKPVQTFAPNHSAASEPEGRRSKPIQARVVTDTVQSQSSVSGKPRTIAVASVPIIEGETRLPTKPAPSLRNATPLSSGRQSPLVESSSSTTPASESYESRMGRVDSKLGSSSTTWSEVDGADVSSRSSDIVAKSPDLNIDACLKKHKTLDHAASAVIRKAPIAFAQSRFWFLEQFLENPASALNITVSIDLQGPFDIEKFEKAVNLVGQRHEALRTRFSVAGRASDGVVQEVLSTSCLYLEIYDIGVESQAEDMHRGLAQHKYRLSRGENMRVIILRKSSNDFRLVIGYHHINMDGVSLEVVLRELQLIYDSQKPPHATEILQYSDFAENQRREYKSGLWKSDIDFWKSQFGGQAPPVLPILPLARTQVRSPLVSYSSTTTEFYLDRETLATIQETCGRLKVSPFHFHLAVLYTLLVRLLDVEKLCIGISSANRQDPKMMQSVGMYLNLLPLVLNSQSHQTFANAMKLMRDKSLTAFGHSAVPIDVIVNELGVSRTTSHSPLFQVLVNYRPGVSEKRKFCGCKSQVVAFDQGQTACDLTLDVIENPGDDCRVILGGQSTLYGEKEMTQLKDMYLRLLQSFSKNPASRLSAVSLYNPEHITSAIELGRGPHYKHEWPITLVHRIDDMIKRYKNRVALQDGSEMSLTYSQMENKIQNLCVTLSKHSTRPIGPGSRVGILLNPSAAWIYSLLATLRLGATYVPLDAAAGLDRLSSIVQDCKPDLLIIDKSTQNDAEHLGSIMKTSQIFNLDTYNESNSQDVVTIGAGLKSVAAIMYTSGSTGKPKGIVIKHESLRNNIEIMTKRLSYRQGQDVTLQQSSYNFDMSFCQIFLALCNGGTLHIVPKKLRGDPSAIASIIVKEKITFTTATPSELMSWIYYGDAAALGRSSWRVAQGGGEPIRDSLIQSFRDLDKGDLRLIDCYGPTEVTFCCHSRDVDYRNEVSSECSGTAQNGLQTWPNYSIYILDANQKPVPVGVSGEVAIGGAGVVAGYLHSELDARGFKRDSWASTEYAKNDWTRLHRTGDIGRLNQVDGTLILGGRVSGDTQIKLRGLRIDLREIESAIFQSAEGRVLDVCVTVRESETTRAEYLIAVITTAASHNREDFHWILDRLALPQYMRPAAIVRLERLPTTPSGKIDRLALSSLDLPLKQVRQTQIPNKIDVELNSAEEKLLHLWDEVISQDVLSQYRITRDSDFFHVGGNSILLMQLRAEVEKTFEAKLSLFQLFEESTLAGMAALLLSSLPNAAPSHLLDSEEAAPRIDWEHETAISPSLMQVRVTRKFFGNPSVVVLTGSTGFLGQAILQRLLEDSIIQKVHCLAVRRDVNDLPKELFHSSKVIIHRGDLSAPYFGLSEETLSSIFSEAHAVIHNGADVSFMKSYHSLKPVNLDATKELVRLSLPHQLSFHYISTSSVAQLTGQETWEQQSVKVFLPPTDNTAGYIASKWACERYLEKVSDRCALPMWIHRPSSITGAGAPTTDLMANLMHFAKDTKAIPNTSTWGGYLDFVSVQRVALQITDEVYDDYSWPGKVKYLYESGEEVIPLSDLRGVLDRETGSMIEQLPMKEWVVRAQNHGMSQLLGEYLCGIADMPLIFPLLVKEESWS